MPPQLDTPPLRDLPRISCAGFGGYRRAEQGFIRPERIDDLRAALLQSAAGTLAPRGMGRSYGDAALNGPGALLSMERLDRFLAFDKETGVLRVEAGVRVLDVMRTTVPYGLALAAVPGLSAITVGGCAAFDVHSKNHWHAGGFGDWVISMRMMLASGEVVDCSRDLNTELFHATIGGLGLTGVILELEIQLDKLPGTLVESKSTAFEGVEDLMEKFQAAAATSSYVVAWIDMLNGRKAKGILIESSVLGEPDPRAEELWREKKPKPLNLVAPFFNTLSNRAFNLAFATRHKTRPQAVTDLRSFLFPWDALPNWNRLYGRAGFVEYQCCIPMDSAAAGLSKVIQAVLSKKSSFPVYFAAVKRMRSGLGMLSFPIDGYSLLLDFPVRDGLWEFLDQIDNIVADCGGRVYLAKDGRLSASAFARMYPRRNAWLELRETLDPGRQFASDMGRRLNLGCR
jgi:decaprenylphospho-beta-D-ribofuranose 2-oxidase